MHTNIKITEFDKNYIWKNQKKYFCIHIINIVVNFLDFIIK
jgi:hypothetical protein